jgi:hypothetical protein
MQLTTDLITNQLVGVCDNLLKPLDRGIKKEGDSEYGSRKAKNTKLSLRVDECPF